MRKPRKEFSKTILRAVAAATVVIVVLSFALMWRTGDTSPLAYIIPGIFTELSALPVFISGRLRLRMRSSSTLSGVKRS